MKAVVLDGREGVSLQEVAPPAPGPGEALVQILSAGICGTDLELARGYMGFSGIPGHEFVGRIAAVTSPSDQLLKGARVVGEISLGCEQCALCAQGMARHCARRRVVGILGKSGAHAEMITLPVSCLRAIPAEVTDTQAVFVEPAAAALRILDQVAVSKSSRILVLGDGRLGLLAAQALAPRCASVTLAGRHAAKMALARQLGLETTSAPDQQAPFDVVVEATGSPEGLPRALQLTRPGGTVALKSTCASPVTLDAAKAVIDEITIIGSRCGRFEPAIEALASGAIKVDPIVSATYPLAHAVEAYRHAARPEALKVILQVGA